MTALLDTHAFLWWIYGDRRFSQTAREVIASGDNDIIVSAITGWELSLKTRLIRERDLAGYVVAQISLNNFRALPLTLRHALQVSSLPLHHRDPFDRALVAQAQLEDLTILTNDPMIARYEVKVLW